MLFLKYPCRFTFSCITVSTIFLYRAISGSHPLSACFPPTHGTQHPAQDHCVLTVSHLKVSFSSPPCVSICNVPWPVLSSFHSRYHLILVSHLWGGYYHSHLSRRKLELREGMWQFQVCRANSWGVHISTSSRLSQASTPTLLRHLPKDRNSCYIDLLILSSSTVCVAS